MQIQSTGIDELGRSSLMLIAFIINQYQNTYFAKSSINIIKNSKLNSNISKMNELNHM